MVERAWLGDELGEALGKIGVPAYMLDRNGIIRWMNDRALELFGDRRGTHFSRPVAPEAESAARLAFAQKQLGSDRATRYESVLLLPSGQHVPAEIHAVSIEDGGQFVGIFGIIDIDEEHVPRAPVPSPLTPRQAEVLGMLSQGYSTGQMAEALTLSRETIRNHVRALLLALKVRSRIEALAEARRRGLLD